MYVEAGEVMDKKEKKVDSTETAKMNVRMYLSVMKTPEHERSGKIEYARKFASTDYMELKDWTKFFCKY